MIFHKIRACPPIYATTPPLAAKTTFVIALSVGAMAPTQAGIPVVVAQGAKGQMQALGYTNQFASSQASARQSQPVHSPTKSYSF
jgi:hypothetical protein